MNEAIDSVGIQQANVQFSHPTSNKTAFICTVKDPKNFKSTITYFCPQLTEKSWGLDGQMIPIDDKKLDNITTTQYNEYLASIEKISIGKQSRKMMPWHMVKVCTILLLQITKK